jgi:hypothetical protein
MRTSGKASEHAIRLLTGPVALFAVLLVAAHLGVAAASPEIEFEQSVAKLKAIEAVSGPQLDQARRVEPGRALQLPGVIQGVAGAGDTRTILLQLVDDRTVDIECRGAFAEVRTGARVRCLVEPADASGRSDLNLVDITSDRTPLERLKTAARAALKFPPTDPAEIALANAQAQRGRSAPTLGGDPLLVCKRAIAHFNSGLAAGQVDAIADCIITYSVKHSVDPYLVVAVVAAESRFNPKARSRKGAMGLGQLMPATAAAHNVNAYDPVSNLEVSIRIISRNLEKYDGNINKALAAYNAGVGAVAKYGGVPPYRETRDYLWRIYKYYCWLHGIPEESRPT